MGPAPTSTRVRVPGMCTVGVVAHGSHGFEPWSPRRDMTAPELLLLLLLAAGGWAWWAVLEAREAAVKAARAACRMEELLLLDDTVAVESMWPVRDGDGRMRLRRVYGFEYSDTGNNRRKGVIAMVGGTVLTIHLNSEPRA